MTKAINSFERRMAPRDESIVGNSKKTLRLIRTLCKLGSTLADAATREQTQLAGMQ